jgi:hypothetical protein
MDLYNSNNLKYFHQYSNICFIHASLVVMFFDNTIKKHSINNLLVFNNNNYKFGIKKFIQNNDKITNLIYLIILEYFIQNLNIINSHDSASHQCLKIGEKIEKLIKLSHNIGQNIDNLLYERKFKKHSSNFLKDGGFPFEFSYKWISHFNLNGSVILNEINDLNLINLHPCVISKNKHSCSFFNSNSQWYFYDSNIGLFTTNKKNILSIGDFFNNIDESIFDNIHYIKNNSFYYRKLIHNIHLNINKFYDLITIDNYHFILSSFIKSINISKYKNNYIDAIKYLIQEMMYDNNKNIQAVFYLLIRNLTLNGIVKNYSNFISTISFMNDESINFNNFNLDGESEYLLTSFFNGNIEDLDKTLLSNNNNHHNIKLNFNHENNFILVKKWFIEKINNLIYIDDISDIIKTIMNELVIEYKWQSQVEYFNSIFKNYVSFNFMDINADIEIKNNIFNLNYFENLIPDTHLDEYLNIKKQFSDIFNDMYES